MSKRPPNRYSSDLKHRVYGIRNWFRKKDIKNKHHQDAMIAMFLEDFGWKGKEYTDLDFSNSNFINARFDVFTRYVQKNYKLWLQLPKTNEAPNT